MCCQCRKTVLDTVRMINLRFWSPAGLWRPRGIQPKTLWCSGWTEVQAAVPWMGSCQRMDHFMWGYSLLLYTDLKDFIYYYRVCFPGKWWWGHSLWEQIQLEQDCQYVVSWITCRSGILLLWWPKICNWRWPGEWVCKLNNETFCLRKKTKQKLNFAYLQILSNIFDIGCWW